MAINQKIKTHTGTIITKDGEKTVQLRETPTTWCVVALKLTGKKMAARLILSSIKPIEGGAA
ncbi:hypothetical protein ACEVQL_000160 [Enterobacter roggenkampii]